MVHKELLKQIRNDLDEMKKEGYRKDYEISEVHLKVLTNEIHQRRQQERM